MEIETPANIAIFRVGFSLPRTPVLCHQAKVNEGRSAGFGKRARKVMNYIPSRNEFHLPSSHSDQSQPIRNLTSNQESSLPATPRHKKGVSIFHRLMSPPLSHATSEGLSSASVDERTSLATLVRYFSRDSSRFVSDFPDVRDVVIN